MFTQEKQEETFRHRILMVVAATIHAAYQIVIFLEAVPLTTDI